jgi:hypothetical protein
MKHGQVTPAFVHPVIPILYVDVDMVPVNEDEQADEITATAAEVCKIAAYPSLQAIKLTDSDAHGNPVYRVEGPIHVLVEWLRSNHVLDDDTLVEYIKSMRLAS